jgi:predicted transcriptional regulator
MAGRKPFSPTDMQREKVSALASYGVPQADIAREVGITEKTLRKHFKDELDLGLVRANSRVARTCFELATSGTVPAATFFWLKCRAGWRETVDVSLTARQAARQIQDALAEMEKADGPDAKVDTA